MLHLLQTPEGSTTAASDVWPLMEAMYPICRSITGDGVRRTLDLVEQRLPLERTEVPTGTKVFDWEIPNEWNIRDAYIADRQGRRVVDFRAHSLHVLNYSVPVRAHDDARGARAAPVLAARSGPTGFPTAPATTASTGDSA